MTEPANIRTCHELVAFLDEYLAGELSLEDRGRFEDHVAACPECAVYLRTYVETIRLARGAYREDDARVPPDMPDELVRAILALRPRASEET